MLFSFAAKLRNFSYTIPEVSFALWQMHLLFYSFEKGALTFRGITLPAGKENSLSLPVVWTILCILIKHRYDSILSISD